jgi:hypothetical protein
MKYTYLVASENSVNGKGNFKRHKPVTMKNGREERIKNHKVESKSTNSIDTEDTRKQTQS